MKLHLLIFFLVLSCSHHRNVVEGRSGKNKVEILTFTKVDGYDDALSEAESYCKKQDQVPYIISKSYKYIGTVEEKKYLRERMAARIGRKLTSEKTKLWSKNEQLDKRSKIERSYRYTLTFRCK